MTQTEIETSLLGLEISKIQEKRDFIDEAPHLAPKCQFSHTLCFTQPVKAVFFLWTDTYHQ